MNKILLCSVLAGIVCFSANASDDGFADYVIGQDITQPQYVRPARPVVKPCPCKMQRAAKPVRVKTYTEVIDHYQVYKPVTVYQPAGTYSERRVIESPRKCNRYGF